MTGTIDFWFSIGSTYTYLTVARLESASAEQNISFNWLPFNIEPIMREQKNFPFSNKPVKTAYMWRDIERRATWYGIPASVPVPYPPSEIELANRIAIVAAHEGWCASYAMATYQRWFVHGEVVGSEDNLAHCLDAVGQDKNRVLDLARSNEIRAALDLATDRARALRIFGSPSFVIGDEVFWGDDRLDDAIRWHRQVHK